MTTDITVPTLLIDEKRCRANIRRMADKARRHGLHFRPHCKTHQSHEVARWLREEGVTGVTVSSLRMAAYFAADEWDDITVAFPVNILELDQINDLASQINLRLLLDAVASVQALAKGLRHPVSVFIEVDTGYGRSGIVHDHYAALDAILAEIATSQLLHFAGFLGHAGHSYAARSRAEILAVQEDSLKKVQLLKAHYVAAYPELIISMGDTPSCSVAEDFDGIDEIRPGNFIFYDLTQVAIGSCEESDIAVAMACPVVGRYPERKEIIIYGGGVHFAKDRLEMPNGKTIYGKMLQPKGESWGETIPGALLTKISQEHGTIILPEDKVQDLRIGDIVLVLPVHSCMCADLMIKAPYGRVKVLRT